MLDAGLSTLAYLKTRILPEASQDETTWDVALSALGLAITRRMEGHCNRLFDRAEDAEDEFDAYTLTVTLRRYPVEEIASLALRSFTGSPDEVAFDYNLNKAAGLIEFPSTVGLTTERLIVTYTGGFYLGDAEDMPAAATPLPDDLLEAFISEVQAHAEARGIFEAIGLRSQKDAGKIVKMDGLTADTIAALRTYRRFSGA